MNETDRSRADITAEDRPFTAELRALLRADEAALDFNATSRLAAARARAVAAAGEARPRRWPWLAAIPTATAASVVACVLWLGSSHAPTGPAVVASAGPGPSAVSTDQPSNVPISVIEQLGNEDGPASEDELDFAQWLQGQPEAGSGAGAERS